MSLRDEFLAEINSAASQCYELGYAPTRFEQMIQNTHPVEVAKSFVASGEFQYGFQELNRMGRPDLTIEGVMLKPKYNSLFIKNEFDAAQWRLNNV